VFNYLSHRSQRTFFIVKVIKIFSNTLFQDFLGPTMSWQRGDDSCPKNKIKIVHFFSISATVIQKNET
jgi:hypothetical protein